MSNILRVEKQLKQRLNELERRIKDNDAEMDYLRECRKALVEEHMEVENELTETKKEKNDY